MTLIDAHNLEIKTIFEAEIDYVIHHLRERYYGEGTIPNDVNDDEVIEDVKEDMIYEVYNASADAATLSTVVRLAAKLGVELDNADLAKKYSDEIFSVD